MEQREKLNCGAAPTSCLADPTEISYPSEGSQIEARLHRTLPPPVYEWLGWAVGGAVSLGERAPFARATSRKGLSREPGAGGTPSGRGHKLVPWA